MKFNLCVLIGDNSGVLVVNIMKYKYLINLSAIFGFAKSHQKQN
ncbi:hypothetical protein [Flavobacterium sp.]|nr:hypothetical protein [Flavobacterium sp.]HSD09081.1 hypothetical protein [Flavobacterium sp.]